MCVFDDTTMHSSVYQWLETCLISQRNCIDPLQNPCHKNYWGDFSLYHCNLIKPVKRYWHLMDSVDISEQQDDDTIEISQSTSWNSILCVEYAYEDYERKIINGEITFTKEENSKKGFTLKSFQRKLIEILGVPQQKVFHLSLPEDVIQRIDAVSHRQSFKSLSVSQSTEAICDRKLIKKKKDSKPMTFIVVGSLEEVKYRMSQFLQKPHEQDEDFLFLTKQVDCDHEVNNEESNHKEAEQSISLSKKRILDCDQINDYLENSSYHKKRKLILQSDK